MTDTGRAVRVLLALVTGLLIFPLQSLSQESALDRLIRLPGSSITVSGAMSEITRLTGYLFTYDTHIISTNRSFAITEGEVPLKQLLDSVAGDSSTRYLIQGRHIILYRETASREESLLTAAHDTLYYLISGKITDQESGEPLPYATIGIVDRGKGTVTNHDGNFTLRVDPGYIDDTLTVSYLGYINRYLPVRSLPGNVMTITLERDFIPIPEVIIRVQDPLQIVQKTLSSVADNYSARPAVMSGFYREGVYRRREPQIYSEAVVRIWKSPYTRSLLNDQIRVLRSRKIENLEAKDTLAVRLKAGLGATLSLDGIKHQFDFIDPRSFNSYEYHLRDIVTIDQQTAYVISFRQREWVVEPLMQGDLYINADNYSLILAEFEVSPAHVGETAAAYVSRLPKGYMVKPQYVRYRTRYRKLDNKYILSHVRGDLGFIARGKKRLFSSRFTVFFELAITDYQAEHADRFDHEELTPAHTIFSLTIDGYDESFWQGFDFLTPEDDLVTALERLKVRLGEFNETAGEPPVSNSQE